MDTLAEHERVKYERMWARPEYHVCSPGELSAPDAIQTFGRLGTVIDFGCGDGKAIHLFRKAGYRAIGVDHVSLMPDTVQSCLWSLPADLPVADFGYCADVMEHIPPERVDDVLVNIARHVSRMAYFRIATTPDVMGKLIGETLHLTVQPAHWWLARVSVAFGSAAIRADHPAHVIICASVE